MLQEEDGETGCTRKSLKSLFQATEVVCTGSAQYWGSYESIMDQRGAHQALSTSPELLATGRFWWMTVITFSYVLMEEKCFSEHFQTCGHTDGPG